MAFTFSDRSAQSLLSETRIFKSIVDNLDEGVIVADREGKFLFFNPLAQSILGIVEMDAASAGWSEAYACYQPDKVTPYPAQELPLARALRGDTVDETEIFLRKANLPAGVWLIARANPLWDNAGKLCGAVMVFRDVTQNKEDSARIQRLTNAVEQTADSIVITNRKGTIEYINPAFEQTTGYSQAEALGQTPRFLKSGLHDAAFYKELWNTVASGKVFRATISNRKKSGEIYFAEQTITPIRDSAGNITHFVSVIKDVTELRKLQEQQAQMSLARSVQQQFYMVSPPQVDGLDIAGAAFPADETGGDYFDFVPLPGGRIGIVIGDISGHGIGSALLMVELRAWLRAFAQRSSNVGEILTQVNHALVEDLEQERYATLILCSLHPVTRSIVYASAGHVPGYIFDASGSIKRTLDSMNVPLGLLPEREFSCSQEIELEPGEILVLLTDGIIEAVRPDQTFFGVDRALDFIRIHRHESARQIVSGLYQAVRDFSDGLSQLDDITAVICKASPAEEV